ncbi:MAG TPA: nuclear transport factor 2 family protein [Nocardioidaceae bacterium]|jgi:ketosteroid isomerase-like protein|nr:nuclear transport factor 2 family protein [Nocardioidaceae bacterium]
MARSPFLARVLAATNAHDVERIVDCFTPDYVNETPCHPERGFLGNEQVRRNWTGILTAVPDLVASLVREAVVGGEVWSEWEMSGTRRDGSRHLMRGVMIFRVEDDQAGSCRFYMEPVVDDHITADGFVASLTSGGEP